MSACLGKEDLRQLGGSTSYLPPEWKLDSLQRGCGNGIQMQLACYMLCVSCSSTECIAVCLHHPDAVLKSDALSHVLHAFNSSVQEKAGQLVLLLRACKRAPGLRASCSQDHGRLNCLWTSCSSRDLSRLALASNGIWPHDIPDGQSCQGYRMPVADIWNAQAPGS